MGATHVWYTGVIRHATAQYNTPAIVKGKAGSPYAITDYYDINPDLCEDKRRRMQEFTELVERTHNNNLKVIIDFVPNHVAREYHSTCKPKGVEDLGANDNPQWAFSPLNNFYYMGAPFQPQFDVQDYHEDPARATGNDCFTACPTKDDWYETIKLNYGVFYQCGGEKQFDPIPDTWHKMLHILLFWAGKGVDGFRCDMAEMVPVEFWEWVIPQVKEQYPDIIFIAEVYNPQLYRDYIFRGHFDYLYDKVGLYDKLKAVSAGWCSAKELTSCWQSVEDIQGHMLNFLENHDEQRIASDFFAGDARKGRPMMLVSTLMNTNPMMIYFGQELGEKGMDSEGFSGEDGRTTIFDYWTVDTIRRWRNGGKFDGALLTDEEKKLKDFYTQTLRLAEEEPAFSEGLFWDLMYVNGHLDRQYAFLRSDQNKTYLVVANFSDENITTDIRIPADAIRSLSPESEKVKNNLAHDITVSIKVKAWDGIVKKIKL